MTSDRDEAGKAETTRILVASYIEINVSQLKNQTTPKHATHENNQ